MKTAERAAAFSAVTSKPMFANQFEILSSGRLSKLASDMLENIVTEHHTRHLIRHTGCFTGKQAVDWMVQSNRAKNRDEAVMLGELLCNVGFLGTLQHHDRFTDSRNLYRFTDVSPSNIEQTLDPSHRHGGIALVAHDNMKDKLVQWTKDNMEALQKHTLYATGTTGSRISQATGVQIKLLNSGPLGGDQQIGALIAEKKIDTLVFFWDPLTAQPHDNDVKALLRVAVMYDVTIAMNATTADLLVCSS